MDRNALNTRLASSFGLPDTARLARMWDILCTDEEAEVAVNLPGTAEEIAARIGMPQEHTAAILDSLFRKGAAFPSTRDGVVTYRPARNIVQLHDATLLWEGAGDEFFRIWKEIMDEDFAAVLRGLPEDVRLPSFMRVIPVNESIEPRSEVLSSEECERLIDESSALAVVKCPCRLSQRNCDAPLETCLQLNRGAEYTLARGHGRAVTKEEAVAIIREAEKAGLVHMTENRLKGNAICNCCPCCCEMFRLMKRAGKRWIVSPSRYRASINPACNACGSCADVCPVGAIEIKETAAVREDLCLGCGLCAGSCPTEAIALVPVRGPDFIPAT